ncbi:hypothetical protein [Xanthomonas theicola]|uniref:hypothetical protein n=1 Tax=Xanthomonas theicola TaxID=56464 RepID=UPI001304A59A|nr:hypothetical protein [Xanthomonas theicola]QNH23993.1 hypothetical protein G4Q83_03380 [Xanthomonas theicola]
MQRQRTGQTAPRFAALHKISGMPIPTGIGSGRDKRRTAPPGRFPAATDFPWRTTTYP